MLTKYQFFLAYSTIFAIYLILTMLGAKTIIKGSERITPPTSGPVIDNTVSTFCVLSSCITLPIPGLIPNTINNFFTWIGSIFAYFIMLMQLSTEFTVISLLVIGPFLIITAYILAEFIASIIGAIMGML
jgi:hypothetical protein